MRDPHTYNYAGFWPRLLAHNIDLLPILGLFYLSSLLLAKEHQTLLLGGIYLSYHILFELSPAGATPGKRLAKIRTVSLWKSKHRPLSIILRNLAKILSLMIFFISFIIVHFSPRKQALHDYIGGSVVLFEED